jgi:hypothetical protein
MEPCLQLCQLLTDMCCWGRRPTVPIHLETFCASHSSSFLKYVLSAFFVHAAKKALFVSTLDTFYIIMKVDISHCYLLAWKAKKLPLLQDDCRPLQFRKASSGLLTFNDVFSLLTTLDTFHLCGIIQTPLDAIDAIKNVSVPMMSFDVQRLRFEPSVPAFCIPSHMCVPPDVLAAPLVMLLNGSTTPDPRLYSSGTQSLWNSILGNVVQVAASPLSKLRYGVLVTQTKNANMDVNGSGTFETKSFDPDQFCCEL